MTARRGFDTLEAGRADLARQRDLRGEPHPGEPALLHRERDERAVLHDLTVDLARDGLHPRRGVRPAGVMSPRSARNASTTAPTSSSRLPTCQ